jgi:predicted Zn-dependent protease
LLAMLDYSRAAEREADEDGLRFLRAAGRTARPILGALCMLAGVERESGLSGIPRLLSSHPHMAERIAHVRELGGLQGADGECPPAADVAAPDDRHGELDREDDPDAPAACRPDDAPVTTR